MSKCRCRPWSWESNSCASPAELSGALPRLRFLVLWFHQIFDLKKLPTKVVSQNILYHGGISLQVQWAGGSPDWGQRQHRVTLTPRTAVAADSVYLLLLFPRAFRFFFCIIRSWAETTPYCLDSGWWAGATSTGSASLGSRAVGFCVSRGAAKRGIGLGVTSSSWCKCGSELVWGGGTSGDRVWKLGWDPSLGTCRGAVRRWMRAWDF